MRGGRAEGVSPLFQHLSAFIKRVLCSTQPLFIGQKRIHPTLEALDGYQVAKEVGTRLPCV